jgi:tRNA(Ile)-lysidine synthase
VQHGAWYFASRSGGETLRLRRGGPRRTLKNLLQEQGLTLTQRRALPGLFHEGRLVWMPGVGMEVEYRVPEGAQGLFPAWKSGVGTPPVLE